MLLTTAVLAQKIDLKEKFDQKKIAVVNRNANSFDEGSNQGIQLDEKSGEGVVWIEGIDFSKGIIEVDLKGKDEFQKSFLGIAFHGVNDSTFDAIYFRPFNFRTPDSVRRIHAVQYISHPQYTWKRLRDERNAQFEKAVQPVPDPNDWFHAKLEVKENEVLVYVNNATSPSLRISKLNDRKNGKLGLWAGEGAGGKYANLVIKKEL